MEPLRYVFEGGRTALDDQIWTIRMSKRTFTLAQRGGSSRPKMVTTDGSLDPLCHLHDHDLVTVGARPWMSGRSPCYAQGKVGSVFLPKRLSREARQRAPAPSKN